MTFLFTDIEGSTRRWEADADAMRAALLAHDKVLHTAIAAHGGFMFKHSGDGVCAAFVSPIRAMDAAIAAQRALQLPVRMGLATGEAELRDGDYFGVVLNRAARVMAAGHGGQILMLESTATLLNEAELVDLGPRRLRDLPMPVRVYQVLAAGLRSAFPPLRALDSTPGNLRPAASRLIGRESELADIASAMSKHRLMTLTGVGGVGKTRLAVEVATQLADTFADGVWLFELAAVTDPSAVPDAVAAVLGVAKQQDKSVTDSVAAAMSGRIRLLVIDNCEHVRDAAASLIDAILTHSATVRILATSREGLGLAEEQLWPIVPLEVESGTDSAAATLFVERARSVAPHFSSSPEVADAVIEICRRLDGIPLAIELAASRMASMTAREVCDRLDQRFRLLVGSRRGARHQTLHHAVAWSYDHLADAEKALLQRCSVCAGGFDLQTACAIVESGDDFAVLDSLDTLVRKSLLLADRSSGRTRYSMLETIRQFADEQLVAAGTAAQAGNAHARHFASLETDILALWDSPQQREAYEWFGVEIANLRKAFRWAADHDDLDAAAAIAIYVMFLGSATESYEPIAWAEELIEPARAVNHPRLATLYVMASQCWMPGRVEDAVRYSDAGQKVIRSESCAIPFGINGWLGSAYLFTGQAQRWVEWCRAQLARGCDSHTLTRTCLVLALTVAGPAEETMAAANGLISAAEATHNPYAISSASFVHGLAFREADPRGAMDVLRRGLVVARDSGNRFNETQLAIALCRLEATSGDPLAALEYIGLAIRRYHDAGNTVNMRVAQAELVSLLYRLGRPEPAATIAGFAFSPLTAALPEFSAAIVGLRGLLGDPTYEKLSRSGEMMTTAAMATYAYEQIDLARAEGEAFSE